MLHLIFSISLYKVDLKCIKLAGGGIYYKQHLSPLGTKMNVAAAIQKLPLKFETSVPLATNFPMEITHQTPVNVFQQEAQMAGLSGNEPFSQEQEVKPIIVGTMTENFVPSMQKFGIGGDRVKMIIAKEPCMSMQDGRAAWNPGMDQVRDVFYFHYSKYLRVKTSFSEFGKVTF